MDILDKARKLESTLARTLDRAAHQWAGSARREPLEVVHAIVDAIGERLEPAGRGTHVFPFNKLTLSVLAGSRETRARFAAVFEAEPTLQERITKRLRDAGCAPADLRVHASTSAAARHGGQAQTFTSNSRGSSRRRGQFRHAAWPVSSS